MSVDGRMIEEGDLGHQDEFASVALQQKKLARERSREKIRRIVVIVSVGLTLLAVLLVTAFLALGSKLEKQAERNAENGSGGSPFAEDVQRPETSSQMSKDSSTPSKEKPSSMGKIRHHSDNVSWRHTRQAGLVAMLLTHAVAVGSWTNTEITDTRRIPKYLMAGFLDNVMSYLLSAGHSFVIHTISLVSQLASDHHWHDLYGTLD